MAHFRPDPDFFQLWWETEGRSRRYTLATADECGQVIIIEQFEQGPFDTSLEVAQWVWRVLARQLPPSSG
jgi:hypothetical protein